MLPWNTIIKTTNKSTRAIYLQIVDQIITEILQGRLTKGY